MTGLTGDPFHMPRGERVFVFRSFLFLTFVMAVFTGRHGVVKVIPDGLLNRISFGKVMLLVTGMAGDAVETFRLMDIRLRTPLATSLLPIGDGMAEPAIFIRRPSDDLEMEVFKIPHLFFRIVSHRPLLFLDFQTIPERVSP